MPDLKRALNCQIPMTRAVETISRMLEATRVTNDGVQVQDWVTVEAGLRIYLEFSQQTLPAQSAFQTRPHSNQAMPDLHYTTMDSTPRKKPLLRSVDEMDALKTLMFSKRVEGVDGLGLVTDSSRSEFDARWRQPRVEEPDPFEVANPIVARKRDYKLVILSSVVLVCFLAALFGMNPSFTATETNPRNPMVPKNSHVSSAAAPNYTPEPQAGKFEVAPEGWASQQAYDEWNPKFDVPISLE